MRHNKPVILLLLLSLLNLIVLNLSGCGSKISKPVTDTIVTESEMHAKKLYRTGNFDAATKEYLKLAKSNPVNRINYQLSATGALIKSHKIDLARELIDSLPHRKLNGDQYTLKAIYEAQISLRKNDLKNAHAKLSINISSKTSKSVLAQFHETRAIVLHLKKEYFAAVKERLLLNSYLDDPREISMNYQNIWQNLSQLSPSELHTYRIDNTNTFTAWLELAIISKTMLENIVNFEISMTRWQQRYPRHPALFEIVPRLVSNKLTSQPSQVALLLPFSGKYNDVSIAIREGFMAARYESRDNKPIVKIYDTDAENVVSIYTQAIAEGADFVVGPLQKPAIANLMEQGDITVTTLVLNEHNGDHNVANALSLYGIPTVIQFGLSPETGAKQVAQRAWFDGHTRAISITTEDERSKRIHDAFASHWQEIGGNLLEQVSIGEDINKLIDPIKRILHIHQSEQRSIDLRHILQRKLKSEARRRHDIDLIFMAVPPAIARQLIPQLRYYGIKDIALYSISNIYTGNVNKREDRDIDGVLFVDMPWVIDQKNEYSPLKRAIERYQKPNHLAYKRFYAFGIDAYRLISRLAELSLQPTQQYEGKTGYININEEGKAQRRLMWAQFIDGKPELIDAFDF